MGILLVGILLPTNRTDKAKAPAPYGSDEPLLLAAIADRVAHRRHATAKRRVGDDAPVPHFRNQIVLADDALAVSDEKLKIIEHERFYGDEISSAPQFPSTDVEREVFEPVQHVQGP